MTSCPPYTRSHRNTFREVLQETHCRRGDNDYQYGQRLVEGAKGLQKGRRVDSQRVCARMSKLTFGMTDGFALQTSTRDCPAVEYAEAHESAGQDVADAHCLNGAGRHVSRPDFI